MNNEKIIKLPKQVEAITEQLDNIVQQNSNFEYGVKDIKLVGQGALTDVDVLMLKDFSNNRREYGFGVEINANGSVGSLVTQDDMGHKVALYGSATTGTTGKPYIWSLNTLAQIDAGLVENAIVQGYELDVNNNQEDRYGLFDWTKGLCGGLNITSGGRFPITFGARIGGTGDHNVPYFSLVIEGAKDTGILLQGNMSKGIDMRKVNLSTKHAIVIPNDTMFSTYDKSTYQYSPVIRFLNGYTIVNTQGSGFAISSKDGSRFLFEIKENGDIISQSKITTNVIDTSELRIKNKKVGGVLSGTTAEIPTNGNDYLIFIDKTRGIPLFWNGVGWVKSDGNIPT